MMWEMHVEFFKDAFVYGCAKTLGMIGMAVMNGVSVYCIYVYGDL